MRLLHIVQLQGFATGSNAGAAPGQPLGFLLAVGLDYLFAAIGAAVGADGVRQLQGMTSGACFGGRRSESQVAAAHAVTCLRGSSLGEWWHMNYLDFLADFSFSNATANGITVSAEQRQGF